MDKRTHEHREAGARRTAAAQRTMAARVAGALVAAALATAAPRARAAEPPAPAAAAAADDAALLRELGLQPGAQSLRERSDWRPPRTVLVAAQVGEWIPELQSAAPGVRFVEYSPTTAAADIAAADAAIGVCDAALLRQAARLAWIQWLGAGVERCVQQPLLAERRPLVTNMQRAAGASMAEHVIALMMALGRHLDYYLRQQAVGNWSRNAGDRPPPEDLAGRTLLVVGLGGIGEEVANRARSLGMRVIATRASGRGGPPSVSYVGGPGELLRLAAEADYVVNCAPLTAQTTALFGRDFFAAMKPTGYFLSVGRGRSTVTDELVAALQAGRIAGAGLDVTDPEPLPPAHPLWHLPNVIITPHISGDTPLADRARRALVRENLRRYVAGDALYAVVDIGRGY